jgi:hypothetical protein
VEPGYASRAAAALRQSEPTQRHPARADLCAGGGFVLSAAAGRGPAASGHRSHCSGHPAGVLEGVSQQQLDLSVEAAKVVIGPPREGIVDRRVDAQQDLLSLSAHV